MTTSKTSTLLMNQLTLARVEALEEYMQNHFSEFKRVTTFDKFEDLQTAVTVMEKVKVMIEYPESALAQDHDLKKHLWEQLQQLYKVKK